MRKYTEARSSFIKERIRKTSWINKKYIDELLFLEEYITKKLKIRNYISGIYLEHLKTKYTKEYLEIMKELDFNRFEAYVSKKDEKEKDKMKMLRKSQLGDKKEEKLKKDWIKAGGKE